MAEKRRTRSGLSLLAVQSIVCGVILLLALLLRLIGGETRQQLQALLRDWFFDCEITVEQQKQVLTDAGVTLGEAVSVAAVSHEAPSPSHLPLDRGTVTSGFGMRVDPLGGGTGFHYGIDVAAEAGAALYAPYDGTVSAAGWDDSYGYYVILNCCEASVLYAHCSVLLCAAGESVQAGNVVARVGSTGDSIGNHVHIEWLCDGDRRNPAHLIAESWYV